MLRSKRASAGNDGLGRAESRPSRIGPISLGMKQMGARSAGNPHAACDVAGAGNVARSEMLRPRPARQSPTLPTPRGLETWHGRDGVTLADERASQQGTQTSAQTGASVPDPTDERGRETERLAKPQAAAPFLDSTFSQLAVNQRLRQCYRNMG